jgi:protein TonB
VPPDGHAAYLHNPKPEYPRVARQRRLSGQVLLEVSVAADGSVIQVRVKRGSGHGLLDRAALGTVQRWRFVPARRLGKAVAATVEVPVRFSLSNTR